MALKPYILLEVGGREGDLSSMRWGPGRRSPHVSGGGAIEKRTGEGQRSCFIFHLTLDSHKSQTPMLSQKMFLFLIVLEVLTFMIITNENGFFWIFLRKLSVFFPLCLKNAGHLMIYSFPLISLLCLVLFFIENCIINSLAL